MQWKRVINRTPDFSFAQEFLEGIALLDSNGVLVVDVFETFWRGRGHDAGDLREEPVVFGRVGLASTLPVRKVAQLDAENRRLDFVEAAVPAGFGAQVFFSLAMIA